VVNDSLEQTELARLLAQLLRVVSPAPAAGPADAARPSGPVNQAQPPRVQSGAAQNGTGPSSSAEPNSAEPNSAEPNSSGPNSRPNGSGPNGTGARADPGHPPGAAADPAVPDDGADGELSGLAAISASEARALIELVAARGIAQGELGGLLGLEKSTVSRLAAGLERKGWIRRGRDEGNQRYVRLYLTEQGRTVADRVLNAWQSRQERVLATLTADERAGLEIGLRGLVRSLAAERVTGEPPAS
jgi:DNA-binding MarR family transcriptional regulator